MIHRFVDLPSVVTGSGPAFIISTENVPGGTGDTHDEIWRVPLNGGAAVQVTSHADGTYDEEPVVSPDGRTIAFTRETTIDGPKLYSISVDGSGETLLDNTDGSRAPVWLDSTTIVYRRPDGFGGDILRRIDKDGSNGATIVNKTNITFWHTSPAGDKVAYTAVPSGTNNLYVVDADGSNDTLLDTGVAAVSVVYYKDGSGNIMYGKGANLKKIKEDGTGGATIIAIPNGFLTWRGMSTDRFFYTRTGVGPNSWKMAYFTLDGLTDALVPGPVTDLWESQAVQRGIPIVHTDERVYTVTQGAVMPEGVDSFVSILQDGSDYTDHYEADESSSPYFQNLVIRVSTN